MSGVCQNEGCVQDETLGSGPTQTKSPLAWCHDEIHGCQTTTESGSPTTIDESGSPTTIDESGSPTTIDESGSPTATDDSGSVHSRHLPAYISVSTDIDLCAPVPIPKKVSIWLSTWSELSEPPDEDLSAAQGFQTQALSHPENDHSQEPLPCFPSSSGYSPSQHRDQTPVTQDQSDDGVCEQMKSAYIQYGQRKRKRASSEISEEQRLLLDLKQEEKLYLSPLSWVKPGL